MINLVDNSMTGHHRIYAETLSRICNTKLNIEEKNFSNNKKSLRFFKDRYNFIKKNISNGNVHFLYFDNLYTIFLFPFFRTHNKVIATLHHIPKGYIKIFLLRNASRFIDVIVVHSEFQEDYLRSKNIKNVMTILYPSFLNYNNLANIIDEDIMKNSKKVLSLLGGTRFDKGLDIFIESLEFLSDEIKSNIFINIVGKEDYFTEEFIINKLEKVGVAYRLKLGYVSDSEFASNIEISDILVLPYRDIFTGNSGPMTEAIFRGIPVITPQNTNIGLLTMKYGLGVTFSGVYDLSNKIRDLLQNEYIVHNSLNLSTDFFIEAYENLYAKIFDINL